jgi:trans-aconitate 2-methyltransferase
MAWNPDTYHKFQAERAAPFEDLLALVNVREGLRVVDLGCGTGELTARLAGHLPGSTVVGIDNSPEMLERAARHERPGLSFELASIEDLQGEWDLIFTHAAIHWVDDHEHLIPALLSRLRPGGQLAVQIPSNHGHLTHRLITEIAGQEPFRTALGGWIRTSAVLGIEKYAELLYAHGGQDLTVFEKVYPHVLANADSLADWTSGTALVPYFARMNADMQTQFMEVYRQRLREHYPAGPVFYGFRRTLFSATLGDK